MADEILNIYNANSVEDVITSIQHHAYNPYTNAYNNNDEIRITIQHQDLYVLPHESYIYYIYIEGRVVVAAVAGETPADQKVIPNFVNNAAGFYLMKYATNSMVFRSIAAKMLVSLQHSRGMHRMYHII